MFTTTLRRRGGRFLSGLLTVALLFASLAIVVGGAAAPAGATVPPTENTVDAQVSADPLPTVQIDGVVWDQTIVGNTVYAVGDFANARPAGSPPGVNQTPRANVLAYDITNGQLRTGFVANTNAQVKTVTAAPDGSRIYIGGQFTSVNGNTQYRIAALNPTTGAVITNFNAIVDYTVEDLAATSTTLYAGGAFNRAGPGTTAARTKLAAFSATNGSLLPWAPSANDVVQSILVGPGGQRVFAGGNFTQAAGTGEALTNNRGMVALDPASGAILPWAATDVIQNGASNGGITDLKTDGTSIFGSGYTYGRSGGNLEGAFKANPVSGAIGWVEDCHGDTYQVAPVNGFVYVASHSHFCGNVGGFPQSDDTNNQWANNQRHALSFKDAVAGTLRRDNWSYWNLEGLPAPSLTTWFPEWGVGTFTGQFQAVWAVTGNSDYVVYGGEFTRVNSTDQNGLVRFARRPISPRDSGPQLGGSTFPIKVVSPAAGQVRVSFPANYDRDDGVLTYRLTRNGATVQTKQAASTYYDRTTVSFLENGLTPGQSYTYRVNVTDRDNNAAASDSIPVTVASSGADSPYADQVVNDGARIFWRLGDAPGSSTAEDTAALQTGAVSAMTFGRPGAIAGDSNTAVHPTSTASRITQPPFVNNQGQNERSPAVDELSVEAWFRTTSTLGGRIIGFGNSNSGTSNSGTADRMLYVSNAGRVLFGVRTRAEGTTPTSSRTNRTIQSAAGLNDGAWHHVVGTLNSDGMDLYVDGNQVASRNDVNSGNGYNGYWRVGADTLTNWTSAPTSTWLNGDIDEAAVYYNALTAAQAHQHYAIGSGAQVPNVPPTASFTTQATNLSLQVNGSGSSDSDGSITSYAWNFGDGSSGSGVTATHPYAASGTYTVTLTVTDNDGAIDTASQQVTVTAPNAPPNAAFTSQSSGLTATFNASGSSDSDGNITSYAWNFGDGASGSGINPSHTYASAGTYTVTLTVTDNDGATDTASHQVGVTAPGQPTVFAQDAFGRTVTNAWGTADLGGTWALLGTTSNFAVNGGAGRATVPTPGQSRAATLTAVSATDVNASVDVSLDKAPTGGGTYIGIAARKVGTTEYRLRVYLQPTASRLQVLRVVGGVETQIASSPILGFISSPGQVLHMRFVVTGSGTTTLSGKVWVDGAAEPATSQVQVTDSTAALQAPGAVGVHAYISGSATNTPVVLTADNFLVTAAN
jgi:PKD repeat protein